MLSARDGRERAQADHPAASRADPQQQSAAGNAERGMAPVGGHVEQRAQDERPLVDVGMRERENAAPPFRPAVPLAAEIDDIDIERTRPPMPVGAAACHAFEAFDKAQQCRRRPVWHHGEHGVEIVRLPPAPDRCGPVDSRGRHH